MCQTILLEQRKFGAFHQLISSFSNVCVGCQRLMQTVISYPAASLKGNKNTTMQ